MEILKATIVVIILNLLQACLLWCACNWQEGTDIEIKYLMAKFEELKQ